MNKRLDAVEERKQIEIAKLLEPGETIHSHCTFRLIQWSPRQGASAVLLKKEDEAGAITLTLTERFLRIAIFAFTLPLSVTITKQGAVGWTQVQLIDSSLRQQSIGGLRHIIQIVVGDEFLVLETRQQEEAREFVSRLKGFLELQKESL
jgi:hypothetical protein